MRPRSEGDGPTEPEPDTITARVRRLFGGEPVDETHVWTSDDAAAREPLRATQSQDPRGQITREEYQEYVDRAMADGADPVWGTPPASKPIDNLQAHIMRYDSPEPIGEIRDGHTVYYERERPIRSLRQQAESIWDHARAEARLEIRAEQYDRETKWRRLVHLLEQPMRVVNSSEIQRLKEELSL